MLGSILSIAGGLIGIVATWFIGRFLVNWLNRWYQIQDAAQIEKLKEQMAADLKKLSDQIKTQAEIEAEFEKGHPDGPAP